MKGLYARFAVACIGIASSVLIISTITFIIETHYHFTLYQHQAQGTNTNSPAFSAHFEQALVQSVLWTAILGLIVAILVSLFVAKRITAPLLQMRRIAERMAKGELTVRTVVQGKDEIAELGKSLNDLAEQLLHQEQLRKTMTVDVAHELRTPLTTLKSHMEAMIEGVWEPTPKRLESCYEEVERLRHLVGDLEQLTEMESPHFKLDLKIENMSAIVQHHVETSKAAFQKKNVQIDFQAKEHITARVDRFRTGQIIVNLIMNALKYTPEGGRVTIEVKEEQHKALITIADTGIGIKEEEIPFVFERFYRADKSRDRKSGGSGIGLTIVKRLVEAHGGTIELKSEEKKGTTVVVRLPS